MSAVADVPGAAVVGVPASVGPPRQVRGIGTAVRLAGLQAVLLTTVLGLVVLGLLGAFDAQSTAATDRSLVAELQAFAKAAASRPTTVDLRTFTEGYLRGRVLPEGQYVAVTLTGRGLVGSADSDRVVGSSLVREWLRTPPARGVRRRVVLGDTPYVVVGAPLRIGDRVLGTVVAAADSTRTRADVNRVRNLALGEGLVALVAGVLGAYLLLRRLLRRVGSITDTAAGIGRGELSLRLGDQGTDDEVARLAATFDAMADRIDAAMSAQRRLLSDVSHQLRTPLTVARGHLEVLGRNGVDDPAEVRDTVGVVVDELDHMRSLVERLLLLGRALEPDFVEPVPVDLRSFTVDLIDAARVLAPRQWRLQPVPDVVICADEAKLRGAMLNLVDNAVRATTEGDVIALSATWRHDGSVVLAVDDSGPGIPPDRRAAVLARFARPGASDEEGSGLGLAIVKAVAEAHAGTLTLVGSALGGLRAELALPPTSVLSDDAVLS